MIKSLLIVVILLVGITDSHIVYAWGDQGVRLTRVWDDHERYLKEGLHAWAENDKSSMTTAAGDLAAAEIHLSIMNVDPADKRLVGKHWSGANVTAGWSDIFHAVLENKTGFKPDLHKIFLHTRFDRIEPR